MKRGTAAAFAAFASAAASALAVDRVKEKKIRRENQNVLKNEAILQMFSHWLAIKQRGKSLTEYFEEYGYRNLNYFLIGTISIKLIRIRRIMMRS